MRPLGLCCACLLALGCDDTKATGPGPLPVTLTHRQPVPALDDAAREKRSARVAVCAADGFDPAQLQLTWSTAASDAGTYLTDFSAALVSPSDGLVVALEPTAVVDGARLEPGAPWLDLANVTARCERRRFKALQRVEQRLLTLLQVSADGSVNVVPGGRVVGAVLPP